MLLLHTDAATSASAMLGDDGGHTQTLQSYQTSRQTHQARPRARFLVEAINFEKYYILCITSLFFV